MRISKNEQVAMEQAIQIVSAGHGISNALKLRLLELILRAEERRQDRAEAKAQRRHEVELAKLKKDVEPSDEAIDRVLTMAAEKAGLNG